MKLSDQHVEITRMRPREYIKIRGANEHNLKNLDVYIPRNELVVLTEKPAGYEDMASCLTHDATMFMPMRQLVDFDKELERICKEKEKVQQEVARLEGKLSNEKFVSRAPEAVVAAERAKLEKAQALLAQLCESEARFQKLS